jgi:starch phosphorylase
MNIIYIYNKLKSDPAFKFTPTTFFFSAKSAASYHRAKLIIKLINSVADLVNNDKFTNDKLKVIFIPNYSVSIAEKLIPATDISEQISTAGKEASGTGNMKFMLNGAITLGTLDGANVEILNEVGEENIFIFGLTAEQAMEYSKNNSYNPRDIFNTDTNLQLVLTQLINGSLDPNTQLFRELYESLLNKDEYFLLKDFESYCQAHYNINSFYKSDEAWTRACIINTARSGKFSSDRTIGEYSHDIWNLERVTY